MKPEKKMNKWEIIEIRNKIHCFCLQMAPNRKFETKCKDLIQTIFRLMKKKKQLKHMMKLDERAKKRKLPIRKNVEHVFKVIITQRILESHFLSEIY